MSVTDHDPKYGCKWNHCGGNEHTVCPFMKTVTAVEAVEPECKHEWRLLSLPYGMASSCDTFYCIYDPHHRLLIDAFNAVETNG